SSLPYQRNDIFIGHRPSNLKSDLNTCIVSYPPEKRKRPSGFAAENDRRTPKMDTNTEQNAKQTCEHVSIFLLFMQNSV
ncbi:MAG: hypothetical protein IJF56_05600, partial [Clostridia bacterium]|nr:hypothetical protein [Clostridia bacterium]